MSGQRIQARASIGVALSRPHDLGSEILDRADRAMYRAKRAAIGWALEEPWAAPPTGARSVTPVPE